MKRLEREVLVSILFIPFNLVIGFLLRDKKTRRQGDTEATGNLTTDFYSESFFTILVTNGLSGFIFRL